MTNKFVVVTKAVPDGVAGRLGPCQSACRKRTLFFTGHTTVALHNLLENTARNDLTITGHTYWAPVPGTVLGHRSGHRIGPRLRLSGPPFRAPHWATVPGHRSGHRIGHRSGHRIGLRLSFVSRYRPSIEVD